MLSLGIFTLLWLYRVQVRVLCLNSASGSTTALPFSQPQKSNTKVTPEFSCSNAKKKPKFSTQIRPILADGKQKSAWFITFLLSFSYLEQGLSLSAFGTATEYCELEISSSSDKNQKFRTCILTVSATSLQL